MFLTGRSLLQQSMLLAGGSSAGACPVHCIAVNSKACDHHMWPVKTPLLCSAAVLDIRERSPRHFSQLTRATQWSRWLHTAKAL
jgi:hypothetical protein